MIFRSSLQDFRGFGEFGLKTLSLLQAFRQLTRLNWRDLLVFGYQTLCYEMAFPNKLFSFHINSDWNYSFLIYTDGVESI